MLALWRLTVAHAQQPAPRATAPPPAAQSPRTARIGAADDPLAVPSFWDPRRRPERPDLSRINGIRFLTEIDYPPFNYAGPDGQPSGFNIDLARAICEEIKVAMHDPDAAVRYVAGRAQQQRRRCHHRFARGHAGDARAGSISAIPIIARRRASFAQGRRDRERPARPISKARRSRSSPARRMRPICGAVHRGGACSHIRTARGAGARSSAARSISCSVTASRSRSGSMAPTAPAAAYSAAARFLKAGTSARASASRSAQGNELMRLAVNWALFRIWENGRFTDLWLRYFPISPF